MFQLLLKLSKIHITYRLANRIDSKLILVPIVTRGATGIVVAWLPLVRIVLAPAVLFSTLLLKSVTHQFLDNLTFLSRWVEKNRIRQILEDEKKQLPSLLIRSQEEFANSNKVRLPDLNWNSNPEIKKVGQRLGIFEKGPNLDQKLNLDPSNLDRTLKQLFKEFGIDEGPNTSPFLRPKSKTVYFRHFIGSVKTDEG
jgi:hypothetical protein